MSTLYEQMIDNLDETNSDELEFGKDLEFNPNDASDAEIQEELDRLLELKNNADSNSDDDELDRIQAEAEAIEEDEEEAKAAKQTKLKKARLLAAKKHFMKKVVKTYVEEVPQHTRSYFKRSKRIGVSGEHITVEVPNQMATVYVGAPGADLPQLTAQGMQSRGGKKRLSDDCDE